MYFTPCSSVSIVNFEHAIAGLVSTLLITSKMIKLMSSELTEADILKELLNQPSRGVLKICSKFTGGHPRRIKLLYSNKAALKLLCN